MLNEQQADEVMKEICRLTWYAMRPVSEPRRAPRSSTILAHLTELHKLRDERLFDDLAHQIYRDNELTSEIVVMVDRLEDMQTFGEGV